MKTLILALGMTLIASSNSIQAATHEHDISQHQSISQSAAAIHKGLGLLKSVNAKDGKVQIAHEPIDSLGWPAMTMWFALRDPLPNGIKVGDTVRFEMTQGEKKQWVVVGIERN